MVSKNGNLLLNVGPMADGTIPAPQVAILRSLGSWLERFGDAIFATRPWKRYAGTTDQGIDVRFTQSQDGHTVYAILLDDVVGRTVTIADVGARARRVRLLGTRPRVKARFSGSDLVVTLRTPRLDGPSAFAIDGLRP